MPPVRPVASRVNDLAGSLPVSTRRKGVAEPSLMIDALTPRSAVLMAFMMPVSELSPTPILMAVLVPSRVRVMVPVPKMASVLLATPALTDFCTWASDTTSTW